MTELDPSSTMTEAIDLLQDGPPIKLMAGFHGDSRIIERQELVSAARRLATALWEEGLRPGDICLVALPTSLELLLTSVASWYCGAAIAPVAPVAGATSAIEEENLRGIIATTRAAVLVGVQETLSPIREFADLADTVTLDVRTLDLSTFSESRPHKSRPADVALIQFTSGSTGTCKGAVIRHQNLTSNIRGIGDRAAIVRETDHMVSWLPLHHDMGFIGGFCCPLYWGIPLTLIPTESFMMDPTTWVQTISEERATLSPAPTFAYDLLGSKVSAARLHGLDLSCWRYAWVGAEPVFRRTVARFNSRYGEYGLPPTTLQPCYGLAEATLAATMNSASEPAAFDRVDRDHLAESGHARLSNESRERGKAVHIAAVGKPVGDTQIRIVSDDGGELGERHEGHVLLRGSSITDGYLGAQRRTRSDWLETGDLGYLAEGQLFITGRLKDLIIRAGANIHPHLIERDAFQVSGVRKGRAAAFSIVDHEAEREEIVLVVEEGTGASEALSEEVRRSVTTTTGVQVDTVHVAARGTVPKTTSGKVQRHQCREIFRRTRAQRSKRNDRCDEGRSKS